MEEEDKDGGGGGGDNGGEGRWWMKVGLGWGAGDWCPHKGDQQGGRVLHSDAELELVDRAHSAVRRDGELLSPGREGGGREREREGGGDR